MASEAPTARRRAIGYRRVSTEGQGDSGAGLEAQQAAIEREVVGKDFDLLDVYTDVASGKNVTARPELGRVLAVLADGGADVLVVSKLDRLSRSMLDFAGLMALAREQGWGLSVVDLGVDTNTPHGKFVANVIMAIAEWEREVIGQRTKDALAAVRARGTKLGRPTTVDPLTVQTIQMLRDSGISLQKIANQLNEKKVATAQGGKKWYPSTVAAMLKYDDLSDEQVMDELTDDDIHEAALGR